MKNGIKSASKGILLFLSFFILLVSFNNCGKGFKIHDPDLNQSIAGLPSTSPEQFSCSDPTARSASLSYVLSKTQYQNTLSDLFGNTIMNGLTNQLSALSNDTFDNVTHARITSLTSGKIDAYFYTAKTVAALVLNDSTLTKKIFGDCAILATPGADCIDTYLNGFAKKIFRRPLTTDEKAFAKTIANRGGQYSANLTTILSLHLQLPAFIWRLELGNGTDAVTNFKLTPYELATRIAFNTTDSTPDDQLLAAADAGQLATLDQVRSQVKRLLLTARGKEKVRSNLMRWGRTENYENFANLPAELTSGIQLDGLSQAFEDETKAFLDDMLFNQNASLKSLLTSKESFASHPGLAAIYGHAPVSGSVPATFAGRRQGLLMRASFLTSSKPRTNLIHRGVEFQKYILCNEIPSPSNVIADIRGAHVYSEQELLVHTNREAITYQTDAPLCMSCHATINPTGFAFESFDSIGRLRTQESIFDSTGTFVRTLPIDSATSVPLSSGGQLGVQDAYDLVSYVADSPKGNACFARQAFRYIYEKRESDQDNCQLQTAFNVVSNPAKSVLDALVELIANDAIFDKQN
ncbi:MAG: DUF1592 domain-containing protein [Pseudobdellovibrionaceae bacterium]